MTNESGIHDVIASATQPDEIIEDHLQAGIHLAKVHGGVLGGGTDPGLISTKPHHGYKIVIDDGRETPD